MPKPKDNHELSALLNKGKNLFAGECRFVGSYDNADRLPMIRQNEIAFAGRSNVGKSSIINAITGIKNLAKTSSVPGRTQALNFFNLADKIYLVDMPGYGFAKAPDKNIRKWTNTVFSYLRSRANLRRVYLLIDIRHGIKENDEDVMDMLDKAATSYQIVLTKSDKIKNTDTVIAAIEKQIVKHAGAYPEVIAISSETKYGIDYLKGLIADLA